ncbi:hypothetical protein [Salipiger sp. PrR003]|nr:hypothetical protein [Salipiger sp. PrR003]
MPAAPAPSISPAALTAAGPRRRLVAGALASALGVFVHCLLPLL